MVTLVILFLICLIYSILEKTLRYRTEYFVLEYQEVLRVYYLLSEYHNRALNYEPATQSETLSGFSQ